MITPEERRDSVMTTKWTGELRKYQGYVRIGEKRPGVIEFADSTPAMIRDSFWQIWPACRAKILAGQKTGSFSSAFPWLPQVDPNENRIHYGAPMIYKVNQFTPLFLGLRSSRDMICLFEHYDRGCLSEYEKEELELAFEEAYFQQIHAEMNEKTGQKMDYTQFTEQYNQLTSVFMAEMPGNGRNTVIAPYAVLTMMQLLKDAAGGTTREKLMRVLCGNHAPSGFDQHMNTVRNELSGCMSWNCAHAPEADYQTANALCVSDQLQEAVRDPFPEAFINQYNGRLMTADSMEEAGKAWPAELAGQMMSMLKDTGRSGQELTLINAVSFESMWACPYEAEQIREGVFRNSDATGSRVTMLHGTETAYLENEMATGFVKRLQADGYSFMALLPRDKGDEAISELLLTVNYAELMNRQLYCRVRTVMPEFRYSFRESMKPALEWLGLTEIFRTGANFAPLTMRPVAVNDIIHSTGIEVNRYGIKTSAAARVTPEAGMPPQQTKQVVLDRPFVFAVMNEQLKIPVLTGVVNKI